MNIYNANKKLLIDNFLKGKNSTALTGPNCLMSDGSQMTLNMELAILSHHFHNLGKKTDATYREKAEGILRDVFESDSYDSDSSVLREPAFNPSLFPDFFEVPFLPMANPHFTFIDLFAGIGGFRMAMQNFFWGGKMRLFFRMGCPSSKDIYAQLWRDSFRGHHAGRDEILYSGQL